ncbi:MAG TPA: hypothetical protein VGN37_09555, partial [Actinocatenispora sp.]
VDVLVARVVAAVTASKAGSARTARRTDIAAPPYGRPTADRHRDHGICDHAERTDRPWSISEKLPT